jgi:hypothetical protein
MEVCEVDSKKENPQEISAATHIIHVSKNYQYEVSY